MNSMTKPKREVRYQLKHESGAKLDGWYVWDNKEQRVVLGKKTRVVALTAIKKVLDPPVIEVVEEPKKVRKPRAKKEASASDIAVAMAQGA